MRRVIVLGSTGSIGQQALEVIARHPEQFELAGLVAGGSRPEVFTAQQRQFPAATAATGVDGALAVIGDVDADIVLNGITGSVGLRPTLAALAAGRTLALANKESLIAGGPLVLAAAAPGQLVPVDSEHSALAQALRGGRADEVATLVLTASGGPFRGRTVQQLREVTVEQAMAHPTWDMGPVITINSATLVNKGLELIEAHLLFGVPYRQIDVVVHPQSIVHSMVTFRDGSTLAQASPPDMRLPIALSLSWPDRLGDVAAACDFSTASSWTFEPLDDEAFPAVRLARQAGEAGGLLPAVYNAANETAVDAFRRGQLSYLGITGLLAGILDEADEYRHDPRDVQDVLAAEDWARSAAAERIARADRLTGQGAQH
ncbi:1-deoxy-D-xylulose-5-phosphate reductoisomerase [Nakamurella aerolata]|uniref:1-deoxy-D-xylulose 5-phosphate reductoisomerase n=1 Tax=Nakamurella aerolata TaxID=1656892 RepID=A0A849A0P0_9ACTN|nr:1-deoxy-D-xylulose-5-phosphate reductoisomerase [Nakamurella aerolata]